VDVWHIEDPPPTWLDANETKVNELRKRCRRGRDETVSLLSDPSGKTTLSIGCLNEDVDEAKTMASNLERLLQVHFDRGGHT
jgi:hypothetical protein